MPQSDPLSVKLGHYRKFNHLALGKEWFQAVEELRTYIRKIGAVAAMRRANIPQEQFVGTSIEPELLAQLRIIAIKNDRSISWLIKKAIKEYLAGKP